MSTSFSLRRRSIRAGRSGAVASAVVECTPGSHQAQLNHLVDPSMLPHRVLDTHFHHSSPEWNQGSDRCS